MIRRLTFIMLVVALAAAQDRPTFRIKVDMVVLSFTITDNKGHYVNGLKPSDFRILEDGITQKLSTFSEGNKPPVEVAADGSVKPIVVDAAGAAPAAGTETRGNPDPNTAMAPVAGSIRCVTANPSNSRGLPTTAARYPA